MKKKIFAFTLALSTLCAVSPLSISAVEKEEYIHPANFTDGNINFEYTDEFIDFLLKCNHRQTINDHCYTIILNRRYDFENDVYILTNETFFGEKYQLLGFYNNGEEIGGIFCEEIVWLDENGVPKIIETISLGENEDGYNAYSTIDFETGEKIILLVGENLGNGKREIVARYGVGDTSCDGTVDVRDVTTINQHIIKATILPDYADTVADVNDDGNIDISDLGMLKKYIVKMIDSF